jgi:hypothetical protein
MGGNFFCRYQLDIDRCLLAVTRVDIILSLSSSLFVLDSMLCVLVLVLVCVVDRMER